MGGYLQKYFPGLLPDHAGLFVKMEELYNEWNSKINVISRRDMENFELHHLIHSLSISRIVRFSSGTKILDAGTGGGFPGMPLALIYPDVSFTLADSIRKKIGVVEDIAGRLGLQNVTPVWTRVEDINDKFDFVISRAVTSFPEFAGWTLPLIKPGNRSNLANGILYLKGGDLTAELGGWQSRVKIFELSELFDEQFFTGKKLVHMPV
jgi:16S rRNA (guanine527-N7)-methyltransferase